MRSLQYFAGLLLPLSGINLYFHGPQSAVADILLVSCNRIERSPM